MITSYLILHIMEMLLHILGEGSGVFYITEYQVICTSNGDSLCVYSITLCDVYDVCILPH